MDISREPVKEEVSKKLLGLFRSGLAKIAFVLTVFFSITGWLVQIWILRHPPEKATGLLAIATFATGLLQNLTVASLIYWTLSERIIKEIKSLENQESHEALAQLLASRIRPAGSRVIHDLEVELRALATTDRLDLDVFAYSTETFLNPLRAC